MADANRGPSRSLTALILAATFVLLIALSTRLTWDSAFHDSESPFPDLAYYRAALAAIASGQPLFDVLGYPPITLLLLMPLGWMPEHVGNVAWSVGTLSLGLGLAALLRLLAQRDGRDDLEGTGIVGVVAGTAFAGTLLSLSLPFSNHLQCGQISILVLALVFVDGAGLLPRKVQGVLIGLASALKLTPLIFILYFIVTGQRRQAVVATASFLSATTLGFLLFPSDSWVFWARLGSTGRFGELARSDNLSMLGTLSRWVQDGTSRHMLWLALAILVGLAALVQARHHRHRQELVEATLVLGAASVAMSPVSWPHHQIWMVLIGVWLVWSPRFRDRIFGMTLYIPYVSISAAVINAAQHDATLGLRVAAELPAIMPLVIALVGLPRASWRDSSCAPAQARVESEDHGAVAHGAG